MELEAGGIRGCRRRGLIMAPVNKVHHVYTIARVAEMLGEDEDWLGDVANEMDQEDGLIWVYGPGGRSHGIHRFWDRDAAGPGSKSSQIFSGCCPVYDPTTGSSGWMMTIAFKGSHFERDVILWGVRWYVAYPISYRQVEEMMGERGVEVDHSTLHRWVLKYVPALEKAFLARKRPVGGSWRLDETYVRVKGAWKYLYRAVDKAGATVDFLLTARRDRKAALRFLRKAIGRHGVPEKITIDKSGANTAAIVKLQRQP